MGHIRPRSNAVQPGCLAARMQRGFHHGLPGTLDAELKRREHEPSGTERDNPQVGIDVGGTFTDVTVLDERTGQIREVRKVPSNPEAPLAVLDGVLADMRAKWGAEALSYLLHGSTHALNTVLEEKGSRAGLLTTRGFRDVYEIARQWKGDEVFNIFYPGGKRFVPRRRIAEVPERLDKSGDVMAPLDLDSIDEAMAGLMAQGIDALAIAFLFSYVNPTHERLAAEHVRSRYPDLFVSLSSEVNRCGASTSAPPPRC